MLFSQISLTLAAAAGLAGVLFYVRPLRKSFFEMSDRARIFGRRGEVLAAEKKAMLENIDEGVITCDREGRVNYLNSRAQALLNLKNTSILSQKLEEVADKVNSELFAEIKKLLLQAKEQKERIRSFASLNEAEKAHLELLLVPFEDDHGFSLIMKDRSNQQKVIEMGKEFIANASHELKTPVTIIRGFAETLKDLPEISVEMFDSILSKIIRNCERMEILIKNLLTLADLDASSQLQLKEIDLVSIVDDACYTILNIFPDIHIEQLTNEERIPIWADASLLELAIFNLLKNAVKYSPSTAEIKITIVALDEVVEIHVEDKGIGIEEKELEKIFDRFYTVDKSHSRSMGGAGLGLSIVRTIIERHQGKITATSKVGAGTTFHIILPRM